MNQDLKTDTDHSSNSFSSKLRNLAAGVSGAAMLSGGALPSVGTGLTAAAFAATTQRGDSAVMLAPGTELPGQAYIDYGAQFADSVVTIQRVGTTTGTISYTSGVLINDAVTGKQFVVTAGHSLDSTSGLRPLENLSILVGTNYLTPQRNITISSYAVHSSYVVGSGMGTGEQIDLAIMELSLNATMPGLGASIGTQTIPNGAVIDLVGSGQFGLSSDALQPRDGNLRAFQSIAADPSSIVSNDVYNAAIASSAFNSFTKGVGANGDSGGGVFYNGELYGIMTTSSSLMTSYVDLTNNEVNIFIRNFMDSTVPEPSMALLTGIAVGMSAFRRKRESVL